MLRHASTSTSGTNSWNSYSDLIPFASIDVVYGISFQFHFVSLIITPLNYTMSL